EGLLADGITVNHAPVCEVNVEPRNPVIGTRSVGDVAERVSQLTAAWVRGAEGAVVASTPKHFPGHGDTSLDSHFTRPDGIADRVRPERTREALRRATWFRERFGRTALDADFDDEPRRDLALQIAEASITQVGPPRPRLDGTLRVLYFEPTQASPVEELST